MRILLAEDDLVSRRVLTATLTQWGYAVQATHDGREAWDALRNEGAPPLAILDWTIPEIDGLEVCRRVRQRAQGQPTYIIMLTVRSDSASIVTGLQAGADDYITKPFDRGELQARLQVGRRIVELQKGLADRVRELEAALSRVRQLQGLLPICAWCKKIRDDQNYWHQVESYLGLHSDVRFSHGICPECNLRFLEGTA